MSISAVSSGYPILQQSSKMAEEAALDLQQKTPQKNQPSSAFDFNQVENKPDSEKSSPKTNTHHALLKLNQAQQYHKVGATVIQREQAMLGSLLDMHV
ncbi:hypothetical protein EXA21_11115 [Vibrio cincinnatiensis]|uniref:Uncharacterized protein n=1 Tax=Vibrio cincinnatiensis DSM 19608 TaxID=1123491 RepID=A0A1T4S1K4_VIBCI|nr:hypothetical protein [Vibrio cincinnatiensis]MCG3726193.1 hypothetical protein [Vibrio cincinnatiensis]MCG3736671.1 hypothetical protein [Vibrio cincinnatiensis]MCG3747143.1 hypothetical protein [Vibrio cincinnatiensis]MCG3760114.1 hypothetical protein [Vibrio cincinnatiensis]MCG3763410.1 hypothetical protein [Vibrio cincinnatiensis]